MKIILLLSLYLLTILSNLYHNSVFLENLNNFVCAMKKNNNYLNLMITIIEEIMLRIQYLI
jgi:serine phosphatase RsbU (regulator of sigma subunit)